METFLNFLSSNKEWLFSGVGASAIIGSVAYIFKTKQDPEKTQTQTVSQNVTVNVNSEKEASTKVLNTKSIDKESISILFPLRITFVLTLIRSDSASAVLFALFS